MSDTSRTQTSATWDQAYDPWLSPDLFRGVLTKRVFAFLIDLTLVSIPIVLGMLFIALFGVVTLGLGWALFWLVSPASIIWFVVYYGMTLGGPHAATPGMRVLDLQMQTWTGEPPSFLTGAMHAVLYYLSVSFLTPFVVLIGLFNSRRRLLQDFILGTFIVNRAYARPPA